MNQKSPQQAKPFSCLITIKSMAKIIEAIYENGVFKPLEKVDLKEGEKVRIIIGGIVRKTKGIIPSDRIEKIIEEIENEGVL